MGAIRRTALMVAVALALLLALGSADPDHRRLMTSFFATGLRLGVLPGSAPEQAQVLDAVTHFTRSLSAAYLALDPAPLEAVPVGDSLGRGLAEEIAFLRKNGRALDMTVRDIRMLSVQRLENQVLRASTAELVAVRYLRAADRTEIEAQPAARYTMKYLLEPAGQGLRIVAVETLGVAAP